MAPGHTRFLTDDNYVNFYLDGLKINYCRARLE